MKQMLFIISFLVPFSLFAQKEKKEINAGNDLYKSGKYADAEKAYKQGLAKNANSFEGNFNLGNAYYKQGKYSEASQEFEQTTMLTGDSLQQAKSFHNQGNAYYQQQQYEKSINAYKASLRLNPNDEQTRYNLALAQQKLKQQQQENPPPKPEEMQDKTAQQLLDAFNQDQQKLQEKMKQQVPPSQRQVEKDW
jgi:tetratricopeptide (TPR) repeat protein